jgi:hypothetical protein
MAIKKKAVAVAVSTAKAKAESVSTPEEAKEITGIWSQEPEDTPSTNKQKALFKGKERIVHWEQHPSDSSLDIGWVKVCCEEAYKGPCTLSDVLALKKKYPESRGFLVEDNVNFNRHNVCVYNKVVLFTRPHVEE